MRWTLLAVVFGLLLAPASAQAGTLSGRIDVYAACFKGCGDQAYLRAQYMAAPGELNRVSVAYGRASVILTDAGAAVDVEPEIRSGREGSFGGRCEVLDAHTARCQFESGLSFFAPEFFAGLHDGDDELVVSGGASDVGAQLDGGPGADRLVGGIGPDVFFGGSTGDAVDGGAGLDVVSFAGRRDPVFLNLGAPGEGERFASIERYLGGMGADRLTGGGAAEAFDGGPGDDRLDGGGGDDALVDGPGDDVLQGGEGDDKLTSPFGADSGYPEFEEREPGGDDRLSGGPGADVLISVSGNDDLRGGHGPDILSMDGSGALRPPSSRLSGGRGDDRLYSGSSATSVLLGGPGDDLLNGGEGRDRFSGGSGADRLLARDRHTDGAVDCGAGRDRVVADRSDRLRGCESRRYSSRR